MSEHLTNNQIEDYGRKKLSAAQLLSVSDHLAGCEACRQQVEMALDGDAAFFALKSEVLGAAVGPLSSSAGRAHLTFERMAEYVDEALAGEELQLVKDHLSGCGQCAAAVNDLRAFKNQVAPELDREYQPHPTQVRAENHWRRFVAALPSFLPKSPALVFGSALAAVLLIAMGWLILQALQEKETKRDITVTTPSPTVSPTSTPVGVSAMVIAQLNDSGGQVTLDREGKLSGIDHLPSAYQQMIKGALTTQQLEKSPLLAGLVQPDSVSMRGGDNQGNLFSVIKPVGKVMLSDRPTFQWSPLEGATGYIVEVYGAKFDLVASSSQLTGASWMASQSLKRGGIYSWQVKAIKGAEEFISPRPPAPQAKFRILDEDRANELARARRAYASSHLTLALLYAQAGLLDEAEQEFRALQTANPSSASSRRLLVNLQTMRR
ncbi:MAG: zf-HC2 domain-containing protein [Blastocatellia bacterium]